MLFDINNPPADFARPFDIWAFSGNGKWSTLIKVMTCNLDQWWRGEALSHMGISITYCGPVERYTHQTLLFESTELVDLPCCLTGRKHAGVQAHPILERIKSYDGKVWRYRLNPDIAIDMVGQCTASEFMNRHLGRPYAMRDALLSGTEYLRRARWLARNEQAEFCSDMVMDLLKSMAITPRDCNSKEYNPARAIRDLIYWQIYQPIGPGSESGRVK